MMKSSRPALMRAARRRHSGAASVAIAMLIMFILVAAVLAVQNMSGSSVADSAKSEEQVAALFLAESGVEQMQAIVGAKATAGTLTNADCTGLAGFSLGRGNVVYSSPQPTPVTCGGATPCVSCAVTVTGNILNASGTVTASRAVRATLSTTPTEGLEGCGSSFTLPMPVLYVGGRVFSHISYRAKRAATGCSATSPIISNARVGSCNNTGSTCDLSTGADFWDKQGTGTNAISSMGVGSGVLSTTGTNYTITTVLEKDAGVRGSQAPVERDYAQAGVLFYPPVTTPVTVVDFMGTYESNTTSQTSGLTGSVDKDWTCQPKSATTTSKMWRAAVSDTLAYGYSGWMANSSAPSLNAVTLGIQPLREITGITGTQASPVYSHIWMSYNKGYYPSTTNPTSSDTSVTTVTGATNGANFTGTIGATFSGYINSSPSPTLNITTALTSGLLSPGDTITNALCTPSEICGTVGSLSLGSWGTSGSVYVFNPAIGITDIGTSGPGGSVAMVANSIYLQVVGPPTGGVLKAGDSITTAMVPPPIPTIPSVADTITYGTLPSPLASVACSTTAGPGPCPYTSGNTVYRLSGGAPRQLSSSPLYSAGGSNTITVPSGAVAGPAGGTAVAVSSGTGTGAFTSTVFTGTITGTALTNTGGVTLCAGDALFSGGVKEAPPSIIVRGIKSDTTVVSPAGCTTGDVVLSRAVDVTMSGASLVARAAVIPKQYTGTIFGATLTVSEVKSGRVDIGDILSPGGSEITAVPIGGGGGGKGTYTISAGSTSGIFTATNPKSFTVSRTPSTALSGNAVVCGGICAMLYAADGAALPNSITFTLSGFPSGNDWSSGFSCIKGIDAFNIQTLGKKVAKRSAWAEIVR